MFKFHENPSSKSRVVPCRRTHMTKVIFSFRNFENAPKNGHKIFDVYFLERLEVMEKPFTSILYPEEGSSKFLRNIYIFPQDYMTFKP